MGLIREHKLICFLVLVVVLTGSALTLVSQKVYDTQKSVSGKSRDLVSEQWELRALKAEWAYLTRPDRLEQLSDASEQSKIMASKSAQELMVEPASFVPTPTPKPLGHSSIQNAVSSAPKSNNKSNFSSLLNMIGGQR